MHAIVQQGPSSAGSSTGTIPSAMASFSGCCSSFFLLLFLANASAVMSRRMVEYHELKRKDFAIASTNWGATILSIVLPDSKGNLADVVLGHDTTNSIRPYVFDMTCFGSLVGRVANRISGAQFTLNGKVYKLFPNDGKNSLHGGHRGFSEVLWTVKEKVHGDSPSITYYYRSFDGEQGFPGDLDVFVSYKIVGDYQFKVEMLAIPLSKPTPVNLVQHVYWNLGGHNSGDILSNTVQIFASHITPTDSMHIPTGEIKSVEGTPFDFRQETIVGAHIEEAGGYNINYILEAPFSEDGLRRVAVVKDNRTGRAFQLFSDQSAVQFYTSNEMHAVGKDGYVYGSHAGLCLETQGFPDAVNHPNFPSQIVDPGNVYRHNMLFKFSFS